MKRTLVVIGGGVGGLTTAALLLKAGWEVTVLEAHVYPGGSAGTFFHKGYRFDAGATLAGGFNPGGPHARVADSLGLSWAIEPVDPAWVVHLPERSITQWAQPERWQEERRAAFPEGERFWKTQERLGEISWQISSRNFPWPPTGAQDLVDVMASLRPSTVLAAPYLARTVASLIPKQAGQALRTFIDAQLLISAQTTAQYANALYGSAALDLPRRGVNLVRGGIGGLAKTLADWITSNGGKVLYRQAVERILVRGTRAVAVRTRKGLEVEADAFAANLTPAALNALLPEPQPVILRKKPSHAGTGWGAFTLYLGLEASAFPADLADHHQVVVDPSKPLGEGNSVFISLSPQADASRAPEGKRAATLSSHTAVEPWWQLAQNDPQGYAARKEDYTQRLLAAAERAIPGIRSAVRLALPGTPLTWQFYTGRPLGRVGGYAQTSILNARGPATGIENVWLVGDSIFPGQSTAGVTLGAMRVARTINR